MLTVLISVILKNLVLRGPHLLLKIIPSSLLFPDTYTHVTEIFGVPSLEKGFSHTAAL